MFRSTTHCSEGRCEHGGIRNLTGDATAASLPATRFRKENCVRRAGADLWTTNRPDARLANRLTKNLKKIRSGQPNGRAGCYSQSSVSVSTKVTVPAHRSLPVPEVQCQH